jgi:hypothetical protein
MYRIGLARYLSASSSWARICSLRAEERTLISSLVMAWLPVLVVSAGSACTSGSDFLRADAELPTA